MNHSEVKDQLHNRPCDGCARCRARWYCAADDAFLCQRCDASVHSANPLARRHERLRLKTSSLSVLIKLDSTPAWHHGITRKARTPRPKPAGAVVKSEPLVPDLETVSADENNTEEEQLLYCVPVLDDQYSPVEKRPFVYSNKYVHAGEDDAELTEFAADMERLLGPGLDEDASCMEGLGFLDDLKDGNNEIKMEVEDDEKMVVDREDVDLSTETLELNFDCAGSLGIGDETDHDHKVNDQCLDGKRSILRLDYEKVITEWSSCNGLSPWGDGERPVINLDECWPEFIMGGVRGGGRGGEMGQVGGGDGGREARVTRYREKRRTRLFAKKIRYEVRKLNAEKRPRMKGRFVKRVSSNY